MIAGSRSPTEFWAFRCGASEHGQNPGSHQEHPLVYDLDEREASLCETKLYGRNNGLDERGANSTAQPMA